MGKTGKAGRLIRCLCTICAAVTLATVLAAGCSDIDGKPTAIPAGWEPPTEFSDKEDGYVTVTEQDGAVLAVNPADMRIRYSKDGSEWNGYDFTALDGEEAAESSLNSLFAIKGYYTDGQEFFLDSWPDCIAKNQYELTVSEGQAQVIFTVGDLSAQIVIPKVIRQSVFEEQVLERLEDSQRRQFMRRYRLYVWEEMGKENRELLAETYPRLSEEPLYILNKDVTDREKKMLAEYAAAIGYTEEQLLQEYAWQDFEEEAKESPVFSLTMNLSLENGDLVVDVPAADIRYDDSRYVLNRLELASCLTALETGQGKEIFLPDGTGAIIDLTQSRYYLGLISKRMYGDSLYLDAPYTQEGLSLPVYALSKGETALMGIIEEGDALAELTANYASSIRQSVAVSFLHQEVYIEVEQSGRKAMTLFEYNSKRPTCRYRMRYKLLTGGAGYVEMAHVYRAYLEDAGAFAGTDIDAYPFYLQTLGGLDVYEQQLMMTVRGETALTTYEQSAELAVRLQDAGVSALILRASGIFNGGLNNQLHARAKTDAVLGGKNGLQKLVDTAEKRRFLLYPEADFLLVGKTGAFDGFSPVADAARGVNKKYAEARLANLATGRSLEGSFTYILHAGKLSEILASFDKSLHPLWSGSLSVGRLGQYAPTTYKKGYEINREEAVGQLEKALAGIAGERDLMVSGSNRYMYPYAAHLVDLPLSSSQYSDYSRSVPFLPMVLHGNLPYALTAANLTGDYREAVLRAIETGAGLSFVLAAQNVEKIKTTDYAHYLSVDADYWLPIAAASYTEAAALLEDVAACRIDDHRQIGEEVYLTVYDNGKQIAVNYGERAAAIGSFSIPARGAAQTAFTQAELAGLAAAGAAEKTDAPVNGEEAQADGE